MRAKRKLEAETQTRRHAEREGADPIEGEGADAVERDETSAMERDEAEERNENETEKTNLERLCFYTMRRLMLKEKRFRVDVEEAVKEFEEAFDNEVDTESIRSHEIPESFYEDEDELELSKTRVRSGKVEAKLVAGTTFFSGLQFKEAVVV